LGYTVNKIYLLDPPTNLAVARQQLLDSINAGVGYVNYIGHAGPSNLTAEGLLVAGDVSLLSNGSMLPIMSMMTCLAGRFEFPGPNPVIIGEQMVLDSDGGAIAVWAPSGLSLNEEAKALDGHLFDAIFTDGATTIGAAIQSAFSDYASGDHLRYMMEVYNLLGDPALVIGWNQE
jgi:hypothetical protein